MPQNQPVPSALTYSAWNGGERVEVTFKKSFTLAPLFFAFPSRANLETILGEDVEEAGVRVVCPIDGGGDDGERVRL